MVSLHRRVREEAPSHVRTEEFLHTLFRRCNKTASERVLLEYPYTRGSKTPLKKSFFFGTGSRRGVTPGRLGARNRWFLKGFGAEGSLQDAWPGPTF